MMQQHLNQATPDPNNEGIRIILCKAPDEETEKTLLNNYLPKTRCLHYAITKSCS
ncbi:hypothetical protein ARSQ2_01124 [Arsenophonus endosymbiont of Bemisia tabaci Q2]|nr:hypothetical protein ARSQ2_01124 [Arsenophonus endosymbiont of Bemisia tabaci Q2]